MNIGKHADPAKSMQHNHSAATVPLSPLAPSVASSTAANPDMLNLSLSSSYYPIPRNDSSDLTSSSDRISRLIKPSSFLPPPSSSSALLMPPISSSNPTAASLRPPLNLQHPHGTPLLNPFPPPTPSASLTPIPTPLADRPLINRERVRDALIMLVQVSLYLVFLQCCTFLVFDLHICLFRYFHFFPWSLSNLYFLGSCSL